MDYYIKTLIAATFGTLGFGMLFKIKPSSLPICCLGGTLTWGIVLIFDSLNCGIFTSNLFASIFAIIFSSCVAIKIKLPSTILLTTCVVPLVPGGGLYYTMQSLISKDFEKFFEYGTNTMLTALGIAGGIVFGSILFSAVKKPLPKIKSLHIINSLYEKKFIQEDFNSENSKEISSVQIHYMHLSDKPFEQIISGEKTVELRLYDEKRRKININDFIEFTNDHTKKTAMVKVIGLSVYNSFKELYENVPLKDMGYANDEIENANYEDMNNYYSKEDQNFFSVIAIKITLI